MKKVYIVYNQWQMDAETWSVYFIKAFLSKSKANKFMYKLEKESKDKSDRFMIEEIDLE